MSFSNEEIVISEVSEDFRTGTCMCCMRVSEPIKLVTMRWNERPRRKNGGGSYWSWLYNIPLCVKCIQHDQKHLVGWDWWDAMDSFMSCPFDNKVPV